MEEKPSTVIYKGMPGVFVLGDVESFTAKLMDTLERYRLDEVTLSKIVAYKSLALWNAGIAFNHVVETFSFYSALSSFYTFRYMYSAKRLMIMMG